MENSFTTYRKKIYASINGTKGNLTKLRKSTLLSKGEKNKLDKVIEAKKLKEELNNCSNCQGCGCTTCGGSGFM